VYFKVFIFKSSGFLGSLLFFFSRILGRRLFGNDFLVSTLLENHIFWGSIGNHLLFYELDGFGGLLRGDGTLYSSLSSDGA
jgi:hypothetical protein